MSNVSLSEVLHILFSVYKKVPDSPLQETT